MEYALSLFISIILVCFSALFSGLTLGLMSLDVHTLRRQVELGNRSALRVYPLRAKGNQLLTTLLLGNVAVNTALSIFLGSIATGIIAGITATALIFIFGEIIPQAVISRHALTFGAWTAPITRLFMILLAPITLPISWALDKILGEELPTVYTKKELMKIISEHEDSDKSAIDRDEERIVHGALQFSQKKAEDVMTPRVVVHALEATEILDEALRKKIIKSGFTRFPVYRGSIDSVIGILYAKDIVLEPTGEPVVDVCEHKYIKIKETDRLDTVLALMLKRRQHMSIVFDEFGGFVGVLTLEDILEEVLQQEIVDEDDRFVDMRKHAEDANSSKA